MRNRGNTCNFKALKGFGTIVRSDCRLLDSSAQNTATSLPIFSMLLLVPSSGGVLSLSLVFDKQNVFVILSSM